MYLKPAVRAAVLLGVCFVVACAPHAPLSTEGEARRFQGLYRYYADAASLQDCASGRTYPILIQGEHLALERAWLAAKPAPGSQRLVEIDAVVELRAPEPGLPQREHLRVTRFVSLADATACTPDTAAVGALPDPLTETLWRVEQIDGRALPGLAPERSPTLRFAAADRRVAGFGGCNRYVGPYEMNGATLRFGQVVMTRMACGGDADVVERAFSTALGEIRALRVTGPRLELLDESGTVRVAAQSSGE